jgi:anaerobic magnesium-protoporphyrin IX monomethyl ester cyclase
MFKVLFVFHNQFEDGYLPLALASLAGMMKQHGVATALFDTTFWRDISHQHLHENRHIREKLGSYTKVAGYNPSREVVDIKAKFREMVEEFKPDLIAATSTSHEFNSMMDFIVPLKEQYNIPVAVGGSHPTSCPEKAIARNGVDFICKGEGEEPLLQLVQALQKGEEPTNIPSLWIKKKNGEIEKNAIRPQYDNLDVLPEADWELFDERHRIRPFEGELKKYGFFESSRGCPYNCSYCLNSKLHTLITNAGKKFTAYRFHTPKEIVRRMKKYKEQYGFNHVQFIDENMANLPVEVLRELAVLYKRDINVGYFTQCRPEAFVNNPEKAKIMAEMGCKMVGIGVESANMELCRTILNRPQQAGVVEKAVKILKDAGIMIAAYYIIGFPTETKEMIWETIELHRRLKPHRFSVRFLHPYPGTMIRDTVVRMGFLSDDFEENEEPDSYFSEPILKLPSPPHPTNDELRELRNQFSKVVQGDSSVVNEDALDEDSISYGVSVKYTDDGAKISKLSTVTEGNGQLSNIDPDSSNGITAGNGVSGNGVRSMGQTIPTVEEDVIIAHKEAT